MIKRIVHRWRHGESFADGCPICDREREGYAHLDAAMAELLPKLNARLEAEGSDLRLGYDAKGNLDGML